MNLPALKRRPFPVATQTRDGDPYRLMHPRLAAIDLLREKIADKKAGLDPYDPGVFILEARAYETVWANRALELVGFVLPTSRDLPDGGRRFRAAVHDDVRQELGLQGEHPPLMDDEPLASRTVAGSELALLDVLHPDQPHLYLVEDDPAPVPLIPAMERARHAAALRVDCGCGTPVRVECACGDVERMTSALANRNEVH